MSLGAILRQEQLDAKRVRDTLAQLLQKQNAHAIQEQHIFSMAFQEWVQTGQRHNTAFTNQFLRYEAFKVPGSTSYEPLRACFLADVLFENGLINDAAQCYLYTFEYDKETFRAACTQADSITSGMLGRQLKQIMQEDNKLEQLIEQLKREWEESAHTQYHM